MTEKENQELVEYRIRRANEALKDANDMVSDKRWNLAVNRFYYACFYAVTALLAQRQIYTKTHAGAKQMLGMYFVKTNDINVNLNDFYIKVFSMRQSSDYEDFCDYEEDDVIELIEPAKE